jgi:hypothetical protein
VRASRGKGSRTSSEAKPIDRAWMAQERPAPKRLRKTDMATRLGVPLTTAVNWTHAVDFPSPGPDDRWNADEVDRWVREHRPAAWAEHIGAEPPAVVGLPEGDPNDLLDASSYGEIMGNALRGKPYGRGTMLSYKSRGQIPPPDRTPGDGGVPRVHEDMWLRRTIRADLRERRHGRRRKA